ncbi:MAG: hypothetical protein R3D80_18390 [Paracoccaceae bacterium]
MGRVTDTILGDVTNILSELAWNLEPEEPATYHLLSDLAGHPANQLVHPATAFGPAAARRIAPSN